MVGAGLERVKLNTQGSHGRLLWGMGFAIAIENKTRGMLVS